MAIDTEAARLLLLGAKSGVSFAHCATLGRQSYLPGNNETRHLLRQFGHDPDRFPKLFGPSRGGRYAEPFFDVLGAKVLETIDASDFEGATFVHDMNQPVPAGLLGRFDVVYDGGTLEHVFNFQVAIRNFMQMVKVGGRVITHTPANNYFGHGFYQFSPELFYRVFSPPNGFEVERMIAIEYGPRRCAYEVMDPAVIKARTPLINSFPVLLYVQARKKAEVPLFTECPQQSDYSAMWQEHATQPGDGPGAAPDASGGFVERLKRGMIENTPALARMLEAFLFSQLNRGFSFRNRTAFKPHTK